MKIYELKVDMEKFKMYTTGGIIKHESFNGNPIKDSWRILKTETINEELKNGDFANLIFTVYLVNEKKDVIEKEYKRIVEFLETDSDEPRWIMNVLNILDAIDYEKSEPFRAPSGKIGYFKKYAFKKEEVKKNDLFKIPELPTTRLFANEFFKDFIEINELSGIYFIKGI